MRYYAQTPKHVQKYNYYATVQSTMRPLAPRGTLHAHTHVRITCESRPLCHVYGEECPRSVSNHNNLVISTGWD